MATKKRKAKSPAVSSGMAESVPPRRPPVAPFKPYKGGVRAVGTVSEVRRHPEGGSHVRVTIRHGKPKPAGMGYDPYDSGAETTVSMDAKHAKRFPFGSTAHVVVMPRGSMTKSGKGDEPEPADNRAEERAESPIRAALLKVPKKS